MSEINLEPSMNEPPNGSDVLPRASEQSGDAGGFTYEQLRSLTVGQLLDQLDQMSDPVLLIEAMFKMAGPEADPKFQPGSNMCVMVTRDVGYIEHVKARMRRDARRAVFAEKDKDEELKRDAGKPWRDKQGREHKPSCGANPNPYAGKHTVNFCTCGAAPGELS